ncbi:Integrase core domain-containing protein [Paracoccus isoporae]|uniref:Integrase core domain-containing protein n=1 Tax=Paracoccus isoporae TaxID=591205 RepID=A0A1G6ZN43_9RHOB|nr:Integrase core domain-containing protein [Paracoccus isoporae]
MARQALGDQGRQRPRICQVHADELGRETGYRPDLHPARKAQQNAYVERYNRTVRHEWLDLYIFETIEEVQEIATEWLWTYNNERPNMGNGGVTPAMKLKMAA